MATILPQILGDNVNIPSKSSGKTSGLPPLGFSLAFVGDIDIIPLGFSGIFCHTPRGCRNIVTISTYLREKLCQKECAIPRLVTLTHSPEQNVALFVGVGLKS